MAFLRRNFPIRAALLCLVGLACGLPSARGELRWETHRKIPAHIRLIALAVAYPRSTVFTTDEVFVAEEQLGREEWRMMKLVYEFLPYQPRLSDAMDYKTVHEVTVFRDPACDETLAAMEDRTAADPDPDHSWRYSAHSPIRDLQRRETELRCYRTSAEDYVGSVQDAPTPPPRPSLKQREQ